MKKRTLPIFIICYLAYTAIYIARVNLSMAAPELRNMQALSDAQYGILGSAFSIIYALGRLITGNISDRKPPVLLICLGLILSGISNICIGFMPPFLGMLLLWSINALAQSMLWSAVLCVVSSIYDMQTAKKRTSIMVTSVATGNILGILLPVALIERFGCHWAFIAPGLITLVAAAAVFFAIQKIPAPSANLRQPHKKMGELLKSPGLRVALVPTFFHGVIKDNVTLWMTVFLTDRYGVNLSQTAYSVLLIPVVGLVGRLLYAPIYRFCKNREHLVSRFAFLICLTAALLLCAPTIPMVAASIALSLVYTAVSIVNTSFLSIYPIGFTNSGNVASVSGIMDFFTYLGAGVASVIYGLVVEHWGYLPMFLSWAVLSFLSILLLMHLERTAKTA